MSGKSRKTGKFLRNGYVVLEWVRKLLYMLGTCYGDLHEILTQKSVLCVINYKIAWQPRLSVGISGDWCVSNSRVDTKGSKVQPCFWAQQGVTLVTFWTCSERWFTWISLLRGQYFKDIVEKTCGGKRETTFDIENISFTIRRVYNTSHFSTGQSTGHNDTDKWIALKLSPSPILLKKMLF